MVNKSEFKGYIKTFSQFLFVTDSEKSETDFPGAKKSLDIFKYLLTNYDRKVLKKELCETFWPDMSEEKAKQNLSSNLYYLRKGLDEVFEKESFGKYFIRSNSQVCWINKPFDIGFDFVIFEELIKEIIQKPNEQGQKRNMFEALNIYKGDFLPFCDYKWALRKRKQYRDKAVDLIIRLIETDDDGSKEAIEAYYKRGFEINPLDERLVMSRLKYLRDNHNSIEVLKLYREFKARLEEEYSICVPPMIEEFMSEMIKKNNIERVPNFLKNHTNFSDIAQFKEIISFELKRRDPKALLLSVGFSDGFEEKLDLKRFSEELFKMIRQGDRVTYLQSVLFILFSETGKMNLPVLIERFYPHFENHLKAIGAKYRWHELKHSQTKLITYGEWK